MQSPGLTCVLMDHLARFRKDVALRAEFENQVVVIQKTVHVLVGEFGKVERCFQVELEGPGRGKVGQRVSG